MTNDATRTERVEGTITHINTRGFGFIQPDNSRRSLFFHALGVAGGCYGDLQTEQQVDFIEETDASGRPRAVDVRLLDLDPATGDALRPPTAAGAGDDDDGNVYDWHEAS